MSFEINPPRRNLSNVQASSKTQDGGAGNTGYFKRNEEEEVNFKVKKDYKTDSFEKQNQVQNESGLLELIKNFFFQLLDFLSQVFVRNAK